MIQEKKEHPKEKAQLHPRNKHRERYDFDLLKASSPELAKYVTVNSFKDETLDFFNPEAVKALNKALLKQYYGINSWDIPEDYLCPPIPGRADYIHYMADVLASVNKEKIPTGKLVRCLDIGVGANCVYPIIGSHEYGWSFVGADIDPVAIESANKIIQENSSLQESVEIRLQTNSKNIFFGVIRSNEHFDIAICNPPFNSSKFEAQHGTLRKLSNLKGKRITKPTLNFGGQATELWCEGGEAWFATEMIRQSRYFAKSCTWFSILISKSSNLDQIYATLKKVEVKEFRTIEMGQGNKVSRIVVWRF